MTQSVDQPMKGEISRPPRPSTIQGKKPPSMRMIPIGSFLLDNLDRIRRYPDMVHLKLGINDFYLVTSPR